MRTETLPAIILLSILIVLALLGCAFPPHVFH